MNPRFNSALSAYATNIGYQSLYRRVIFTRHPHRGRIPLAAGKPRFQTSPEPSS